jgi:hypothetical protein
MLSIMACFLALYSAGVMYPPAASLSSC